MHLPLPTNVSTGKVSGRFIVGVADGPDPDDEPDALPAQGRITFTASVPYLPNPTAAPAPATVLKVPIFAVLDDEGFLCTPDPADPSKAGARGIRLIATDDPDLSVQGWTWTVTYAFEVVNGVRPDIQSHAMALPAGAVVDLTTVVKVPSSTGIGTEQAEALAAAAQAAAAEASLAASVAADAAQATDTGVATLVSEGTATPAALAERYVVRRVWDGTAYPARVEAATNVFVGPVDPGLAMDPEMDLWAQPDTVTLADVTAELSDTQSALRAATLAAAAGTKMFVSHTEFTPITPDERPSRGEIGPDPRLAGWLLPGYGPTSRVGAELRTPAGWSSLRVFVLWAHSTASPDVSQSVRWEVIAAHLTDGTPFTSGSQSRYGTSTVPAQYVPQSGLVFESGGAISVDPAGSQMRLTVTRRTDSAQDTFAGTALFRGVLLERVA